MARTTGQKADPSLIFPRPARRSGFLHVLKRRQKMALSPLCGYLTLFASLFVLDGVFANAQMIAPSLLRVSVGAIAPENARGRPVISENAPATGTKTRRRAIFSQRNSNGTCVLDGLPDGFVPSYADYTVSKGIFRDDS